MTLSAPRLGAIAVLFDGENVLLARRRNPPDAGLWGFPGGHVELGESALDAAAREVFEETGITAEPLEYLTNIDVVRHGAEGRVTVHYLLAAVLCRYVRGTPMPADDVTEATWVPLARLRAGGLVTSDRVLPLAEQALLRLQARRD
ncbi:NUDIX hydrolase [Sedimentitalea arenosa]|uniref:NUDIX hydrolase n=1 Tax=Sedimentitalea arenosa TaxID=2798803 RepID=A0A8J7J115_9RHOB|nr:NUDIX hydrolase [Arenibacterium arenosum]MBJ6371260.1 NUDIX hydrolase [Arenibacterium arenosum]